VVQQLQEVAMKVKSLIQMLENMDPEANVYVCHQPNWPLELTVANVVSREDTLEDPEDEFEERDGSKKNDAIIVAGSHARYGSRNAWGC
jgi:hypothetical protein